LFIKILLLSIFIGVSSLFAQKDNITLMFSGDVTLSDHFERHVGSRYDYAFKKLDWFTSADVTMINLETTLTKTNNPIPKPFNFKARPRYAKMLKDSGIDLVTLANNHMYDFGPDGLMETIRALDEAGVEHIGAGKNIKEARKPVIITIKGVKLAYLGYYGGGRYGESFPATRRSAGTAMRNLGYIGRDIAAVRDSVDLIIINFHWGREKAHYPEESEINFAREAINLGADIIIGHHPHVLQGIEIYRDKLIVYSLGNFIFGGNSRTLDRSAVLRINIDPWQPQSYKTALIPVQIDYWQPHRLHGVWADTILTQLQKYSAAFPFTESHIDSNQILIVERKFFKPQITKIQPILKLFNDPFLYPLPFNKKNSY